MMHLPGLFCRYRSVNLLPELWGKLRQQREEAGHFHFFFAEQAGVGAQADLGQLVQLGDDRQGGKGGVVSFEILKRLGAGQLEQEARQDFKHTRVRKQFGGHLGPFLRRVPISRDVPENANAKRCQRFLGMSVFLVQRRGTRWHQYCTSTHAHASHRHHTRITISLRGTVVAIRGWPGAGRFAT